MMEPGPLWDELTAARQDLLRAAMRGLAPPRHAVTLLDFWPEECARVPVGEATTNRLALAWGNLQLLLIDAGPEIAVGITASGDTGAAWQRIRRSVELCLEAVLDRPEWGAVREDFRQEVLPWITDAVGRPRESRLVRCRATADRLRALALRTSGLPQAWTLQRLAEMAYPLVSPAGWHARMGEDFTWRRAQAVIQALLETLLEEGGTDVPLVVGYDSRVQADRLAALVAEVATAYGQAVHLCQRDTPTPAVLTYLADVLGIGHAAGVIMCTAGAHPVKDAVSGGYTGQEYHGITYYTPYGGPPPSVLTDRISRRAAELLLEESHLPDIEPAGAVLMINPHELYTQRLLAALGHPVPDEEGETELAREAIRQYWRQPGARIIIDEMHGAARGYLRAVGEALQLPIEVWHGERAPILGDLIAADPTLPHLQELVDRITDVREEGGPVIGLAVSADGARCGAVDETGTPLPPGAVLALLTEYLLHEGYPGEPGMIIRTRDATRAVDRLMREEAADGRLLQAQYQNHLPPYLQAATYQRLTGDPQALFGDGVYIVDDSGMELAHWLLGDLEAAFERRQHGELPSGQLQALFADRLDHLLIAGDAHGEILTHGHGPVPDGLWAAVLLLACCAVRRTPLGELWRRLQARIGPTQTEYLELAVPDPIRLALITRYMDEYAKAGQGESRLAGTTVRFAGGVRDRYVEWALQDAEGHPAYLTVRADPVRPLVHLAAEAATPEVAHHLVMAGAERVEQLLTEQIRHAETPWHLIELLGALQPTPSVTAELPGTLTCRLVQQVYARLQELAHPGREAAHLMQFVIEQLRERLPATARAVQACYRPSAHPTKPAPPPPRVHWEGEEGQRGG